MYLPSVKIVWLSSIIALLIAGALWARYDKISNTTLSEPKYCGGELAECVGQRIKFSGMISNDQFQHATYPSGSYTEKTLLANKRYGVVIIYTRNALNLPVNTKIEVVGTVVDASLAPEVGTKMSEGYHDYQILVDDWKLWEIQ